MVDPLFAQLIAVVVGGVIAISGGFASTTLLERQRRRRDERNLALALRGEIAAILVLIRERAYIERFDEVIALIEASGRPFHMPFRIRYRYDRVYDANVERIGQLAAPLPERIAAYYTRMASVLEDMVSLGDGTYDELDVPNLLRIYRGARAGIASTVSEGEALVEALGRAYGPSQAAGGGVRRPRPGRDAPLRNGS